MLTRRIFLAILLPLLPLLLITIVLRSGNSAADTSLVKRSPISTPSISLLAQRASFIVRGQVLNVRNMEDRIHGKTLPFVVATIHVSELAKGSLPTSIEVRDLGGPAAANEGISFSNQVTFTPGSEVILFLEELGPADHRYLSPLALRHGVFTIVSDKSLGQVALDEDELDQCHVTHLVPNSGRLLLAAEFWSALRTGRTK